MSQSDIFNEVKSIVVDKLSVDNPDNVVPDANFADDLGADSLDVVELVMALEDKFGIEIPDEDAEGITTVQQAIDYINSKSGVAAS